ncbi:SDR family NAD(P)-dependent oxidoreductase [Caulobacter sp. UNC358MFTsu5.1]|uniref:SDR family NAD(P)-dependent oxidoreductase n=1 Tax=Caulobacter sp. UNC358MFTsu5.1 TaxID=1449049 RepID=UPI0004A72807|nr:SDR family NAD(P)-dependent oxidoreductase [Caulobacter sp. UNC358MFTsu5.1]
MSMDLSGRAALVTGASSGFGEAVALGLAKAGAKVALAARREDRLRDLAARIQAAGGEAHVIVADFTQEDQAQRAVREAEAAFGRLDILINNAGVMYLEPVATADLARWRSMLELNLLGLIAATQAALPGMTARKDGHIVNIASTAAHVANPMAAAYSATKFGVAGFSEALRKEVHKDNIRVSVISPGMAATELRDHIAVPAVQSAVNKSAAAMRQLTAEDVADAILYTVSRPPHVMINEILMRSTDQER